MNFNMDIIFRSRDIYGAGGRGGLLRPHMLKWDALPTPQRDKSRDYDHPSAGVFCHTVLPAFAGALIEECVR